MWTGLGALSLGGRPAIIGGSHRMVDNARDTNVNEDPEPFPIPRMISEYLKTTEKFEGSFQHHRKSRETNLKILKIIH